MAESSEKETKYTDPILCAHCGNTGRPRIACSFDDIGYYEDEPGNIFEAGTMWQLCYCEVYGCHKMTLRVGDWHEQMETEDFLWKVLYPAPPKKLSGLPSAIQQAYDAAQSVRKIDANAYATLLGRLLELVCLDQGAVGDTLVRKLQDLAVAILAPPANTAFQRLGGCVSYSTFYREQLTPVRPFLVDESALKWVFEAIKPNK